MTIAGLNVGGAVDIDEMRTETHRMSTRAPVKSKGKVRVKIGKVTGGAL